MTAMRMAAGVRLCSTPLGVMAVGGAGFTVSQFARIALVLNASRRHGGRRDTRQETTMKTIMCSTPLGVMAVGGDQVAALDHGFHRCSTPLGVMAVGGPRVARSDHLPSYGASFQ